MDKEIKAFIDEEYKSIYSSLNISWLKGLKSKKEEISHKGLANSGVEQTILTNYAIGLVKDNNLKIKELIEKSQKNFNFEMSIEDIENYVDKSIDNNVNYLQKFEKELLEYFDKKKMPLVESCKMQFRNAKSNNKSELEKIKKELVLINKGKKIRVKDEKKELNIGYVIGVVGILVSIIIAILTFIYS